MHKGEENMTLSEMENINYKEALKLNVIEEKEIKGHTCIFAELEGRFGYSVLVFKNGRHVYHADDFELHHGHIMRERGRDGLRQFYITSLSQKLYTDEELMENAVSYDEYHKKDHFLRNYWIMRYECETAFGIGKDDKRKLEKVKKKLPYFNPISFCYVGDASIIDDQHKYMFHLKKSFKTLLNNPETFRQMIRRELDNHEACITCDYTEALQALGLEYEKLSKQQQGIVSQEFKAVLKRS